MRASVILFVLGLIWAGTMAAGGALAQPGEAPGGAFQDRLLEIKRSQLGPALGVDQRTVEQLVAIDRRYNPRRQQLTMEVKAELRRLQEVMQQPSPPEAQVRTILANMKRKKQEMLDLQQRQDEEEMALLNPVQQARYLMYLMTMVREARSVKEGPRRSAPGAPLKPPRELPVGRTTP